MNLRYLLAGLAFVGTLGGGSARGENWPHWRGPRQNGISNETGIATKWTKTENVKWRAEMPGPAGATPVVWDDNIFVTSATSSGELVLLCLGTDGKTRWSQTMAKGNRVVRDGEGNSASPTPSTDGSHVWAFMATGDLGCYDFSGKQLWKFNLQDRYGKFNIAFGLTSSPVLDGDRLYLQCMFTGDSYVVALEKATGKEIWRVKRSSDARDECEHSYASPVLYRDGKHEFLLSHGADYVVAHNLTDGAELWRCGGLNPKGRYNNTLRFVASPTGSDGLIVVPSAKNGPVLGLRPDGSGDISTTADAHHWVRKENTPDVPSPLILNGLVYLCRENGVLICMDAATGAEIYQQRTHQQRHRASPIYADGKVYLAAADGVVSVVEAGRTFKLLASNHLGEPLAASPVISNRVLYLRTYNALYAIADSAEQAAK